MTWFDPFTNNALLGTKGQKPKEKSGPKPQPQQKWLPNQGKEIQIAKSLEKEKSFQIKKSVEGKTIEIQTWLKKITQKHVAKRATLQIPTLQIPSFKVAPPLKAFKVTPLKIRKRISPSPQDTRKVQEVKARRRSEKAPYKKGEFTP
ncbi:hypothetical protein ANCCEY_13121 [Ancylostoma ceylanicum]|uniref:Uncharacterized protein n=2 Tax=Ancylostoma ceylanicum TaxID=53326 RepID=A0A016VB83_9BILA|nr:hypothetical protein ANCCEY_13121 [Ancylostoma ceylanicum]EYC24924.1 hypothetical protein Y032_0013g2182 [Ancylostoma ceylanicum]